MAHKYHAQQIIAIGASECGTEIELTMAVAFTFHPGRKATQIDPPEEPSVEIDKVRFFDGKDELQLPWSIEDRFTSADAFKDWLIGEAAEQRQSAAEDAADAKREMMREDRL